MIVFSKPVDIEVNIKLGKYFDNSRNYAWKGWGKLIDDEELIIDDEIRKNGKIRVLDLGCGRGILLENLRETKNVNGLGVDFDCDKASACISRGVAVYQGDIRKALSMLPDNSFDWVVFSRMVEELPEPGQVILDALRVGKRVAVSFVNHGYWKNRLYIRSLLCDGSR